MLHAISNKLERSQNYGVKMKNNRKEKVLKAL